MPTPRAVLIWGALALALAVPMLLAAASPLLAWRGPIYIFAGFCGVLALMLLLVQPLLAGGLLSGLTPARSRRWHRRIGVALVACVVLHVVGLWITSPPDVIDVLLFRSPTPFSVWGVLAMWALFATALLAVIRGRGLLKPAQWRAGHFSLAVVIAVSTVLHAVLIDGTMEFASKVVLCGLVLAATGIVIGRARRSARRTAAPPAR